MAFELDGNPVTLGLVAVHSVTVGSIFHQIKISLFRPNRQNCHKTGLDSGDFSRFFQRMTATLALETNLGQNLGCNW